MIQIGTKIRKGQWVLTVRSISPFKAEWNDGMPTSFTLEKWEDMIKNVQNLAVYQPFNLYYEAVNRPD